MKVRDIIKQLNKFYNQDDDLYVEYWDVNGLKDLYIPDEGEVMPKEAVVYIINQLDKYWHGDNDGLFYTVMDYYERWKREQKGDKSDDSQSA